MSLAVTNLNLRTNIDDLSRAFSPSGEMNECRLVLNDRNESQGYGCVGYGRNCDAVEALHAMDAFHIDGREICVGWTSTPRAKPVAPSESSSGQSRTAPK
jgi:RNA recognition motif-containing protein